MTRPFNKLNDILGVTDSNLLGDSSTFEKVLVSLNVLVIMLSMLKNCLQILFFGILQKIRAVFYTVILISAKSVGHL